MLDNPIRYADPLGDSTIVGDILRGFGNFISNAFGANSGGIGLAGALNTPKQSNQSSFWQQTKSIVSNAFGANSGGIGLGGVLNADKLPDPTAGMSQHEKITYHTEQIIGVVGAIAGGYSTVKGVGGAKASGISNPIPGELARVVPNSGKITTLGKLGTTEAFVTASADIKGMNATQIANRLTIPESGTGFKVITFNTPFGIATPINRNIPGFIGGGRTAGGAREFVVPNQIIPKDAKIKTIN